MDKALCSGNYAFTAAAIALVLLNVIFPDVLLVGVTGALASMFIQFSLQDPKRLKDALSEVDNLARMDQMTGLYNRRSFDEDCRNLPSEKKKPPITMLAMDLNNLKACNYKRGPITGDRYIFEAATLINDIWGKYGRCYRVGGDEFCCILLDMPRSKFEEEMKNYTQQVQKKSLEITDSHFGIATGYTFFNPQKDASLEEVRVRVDAAMYANKAEMKSSYYSRLETMD